MQGRLFEILLDSFPKMFVLGVKVTVPLAIFSFILAFVISLIVPIEASVFVASNGINTLVAEPFEISFKASKDFN